MWTYCITRVCIILWRLSAILFFCWISPPVPGQIYVFVWPQYMYIRWSRIFIGNFSLIENVLEFRNWWSLDQKFPKKPCKKWCIRKVTHFWEFRWTKNVSLFGPTVYIKKPSDVKNLILNIQLEVTDQSISLNLRVLFKKLSKKRIIV